MNDRVDSAKSASPKSTSRAADETTSFRNGLALAAREHLASGKPLTRMEAIVLYGVANLPDVVKEMRRQGWVIKSRNVSYAVAMARLNRVARFEAPKNLPIKEIQFTEYWITK